MSPEKLVQQLRVSLLCSSEIIRVQLDAETGNPTEKNWQEKSSEEFPHSTGKLKL